MQTSTGIRERIDHVYPSLRPAERAVAQYVRDHLAETSELTVGQLAEVAHVSEPTVIRFSRKLGFGGYRELRYVLRHPQAERRTTFDPLEGFDLNPWDKLDDVPGKAVNATRSLLDDLLASLDRKELHKAVSLIANARLIDIVGVENSLVPATDLFTKLNYLGLTCRLNADAYMQQIGAGHLEPDDVVVAFSHSGRSADTIKALRLAKSRDAHTIVITNIPDSPLATRATCMLQTATRDKMLNSDLPFSHNSINYISEVLFLLLCSDVPNFKARAGLLWKSLGEDKGVSGEVF